MQHQVLPLGLSMNPLAVWSSLASALTGITVFGLVFTAHKKLLYRLETMP